MLLAAAIWLPARSSLAAAMPGAQAPATGTGVDATDLAKQADASRVALIERLSPTVVCVFDSLQRGGGSGVLVEPEGIGLTNFHVVADMLEERRGLGGLSDGRLYDLEVLGIDPGGDVAMFRLLGPHGAPPAGDALPVPDPRPFAPLADSDAVQVGDAVLAMGNPFVLAEDYAPTVTFGRVTGVHRYQYGEGNQLVYSDCIQTDAAINPGNSGGPLFNMKGEVIGINGRISINTRGRLNVGVAYAISSNQIRRFVPGLRAGLLVRHGTLQATVRDIAGRGVIFDRLLEDAPAWDAGVRPGDRLLTIDGIDIRSANHFASLLGTYPENWPIALRYEREGQVFERQTKLEPVKPGLAGVFPTDPTVSQSAAAAWKPGIGAAAEPSSDGLEVCAAIEAAMSRTVRLYGLGAGMEPGYGAGIVVSADGKVLTALSLLIDARRIKAVTRDGSEYQAEVLRRDEERQLALLQITGPFAPPASDSDAGPPDSGAEASSPTLDFPWFDLAQAAALAPGDAVVAAGNPFRIAEGAEALSLAHGVYATRIPLSATRRLKDFPYHGDVLVIDAITSNPGFAGGCLVDLRGRLAGMIGRDVRLSRTHTHLNYAIPADVLSSFLADVTRVQASLSPSPRAADASTATGLGIRLVQAGYRTRLPFVERVVADSPAARAGVRPDDLILAVGGHQTPDARAFEDAAGRLKAGESVELVLRRGSQILTVRVELPAAADPGALPDRPDGQ